MNKIYVFGDFDYNNWVYDPLKDSWNQISSMNEFRKYSSCTVFQGQCVVLGGEYNNYIDKKVFKTVESYDHHLDKWSFLPEMQAARC